MLGRCTPRPVTVPMAPSESPSCTACPARAASGEEAVGAADAMLGRTPGGPPGWRRGRHRRQAGAAVTSARSSPEACAAWWRVSPSASRRRRISVVAPSTRCRRWIVPADRKETTRMCLVAARCAWSTARSPTPIGPPSPLLGERPTVRKGDLVALAGNKLLRRDVGSGGDPLYEVTGSQGLRGDEAPRGRVGFSAGLEPSRF